MRALERVAETCHDLGRVIADIDSAELDFWKTFYRALVTDKPVSEAAAQGGAIGSYIGRVTHPFIPQYARTKIYEGIVGFVKWKLGTEEVRYLDSLIRTGHTWRRRI